MLLNFSPSRVTRLGWDCSSERRTTCRGSRLQSRWGSVSWPHYFRLIFLWQDSSTRRFRWVCPFRFILRSGRRLLWLLIDFRVPLLFVNPLGAFRAKQAYQARVSSDTPSVCALAAVAPAVRFSRFAILATPVLCFANNFRSRTSSFRPLTANYFFLLGQTVAPKLLRMRF